MVKITPELLTKCPSRTNKKKGESQQQYLKRLTHVYLAEKSIDEIVSSKVVFLNSPQFKSSSFTLEKLLQIHS